MVSHLIVVLGWVDFDWGVPRFHHLSAHPLLQNSHQPRHNQADSGTLKIQVNPNQVYEYMGRPVQVLSVFQMSKSYSRPRTAQGCRSL